VKEWYYVQAGQPYGPFTLDQLLDRLAVLAPDTLVWHSDLAAWTPADALPEITARLAAPASAAPFPLGAPSSGAIAPAVSYPSSAYAPWPTRAASMLVDQLLVFGPPLVTFGIIHALKLTDEKGDPKGLGLVLWVAALLAALGLGLWNRIFRDGTTGQSLGRQVTGTRLVSLATGQPIGMPMVLVRQLAHIIDNMPCICAPIGFLWPLWDDKRQTFADKLVGTVVVREGAAPEIV